MRDVQSEPANHEVEVDKVGVKDVKYPIVVRDKAKKEQHTIADINIYVNLPHQFRGTHMSRFIEVLNKHRGRMSVRTMEELLREVERALDAHSAHLEMSFPYFIEKAAPVSGAKSLMEYKCRFIVSHRDQLDFILEVNVPVTNLCPCSKEISEQSAHNQRSIVTVQLTFKEFVWIEDVIALVEQSASCELYSLLKREDEKYVTERAYSRAMFAEDVVREIAQKLESDANITWFTVASENFESIHNHNAYAFVEKKLRK
ncbi:MAG: GTP cyclohydrolase I FolE2 [Candidatus Abyssobacteria bacterium SURF_17]|uniref:GTP cyclohydrolase FolE2 n=1 Tax=Candidatus Abyssobacteria bacterium SURF_17 TaxID=2093361 RepID=A0A419EQK0_9BACT|nr:MAG: GTP cyclohydrolase I FolE2 [Candidatus Abyssubacteria bacterium SURF_17]